MGLLAEVVSAVGKVDRSVNVMDVLDGINASKLFDADILKFESESSEEWVGECETCKKFDSCNYRVNTPNKVTMVLEKYVFCGEAKFYVVARGCEEGLSGENFRLEFYDGISAMQCLAYMRDLSDINLGVLIDIGFDIL
jgi:hypothetical protein